MKTLITSQKGFGMVEAIIALAIAGVGAYMVAANMESSLKNQKTLDMQSDANQLSSQIQMALNKSDTCAIIFGNQPLAANQQIVVRNPTQYTSAPAPAASPSPSPSPSVTLGAGPTPYFPGMPTPSPTPSSTPSLQPAPVVSLIPIPVATTRIPAGGGGTVIGLQQPAYVIDPMSIARAGQKFGNLNITSVTFENINNITPTRHAAELVVTATKANGGIGFFGSNTVNKRFPMILTSNGGVNPLIQSCYGESSAENATAESCVAMGGVYIPAVPAVGGSPGSNERCDMPDVILTNIPSDAPTRHLAGLACDVRPEYCPAAPIQSVVLNPSTNRMSLSSNRIFTVPNASTSSAVRPLINTIKLVIDYNEGDWKRGEFDLYVDNIRLMRIKRDHPMGGSPSNPYPVTGTVRPGTAWGYYNLGNNKFEYLIGGATAAGLRLRGEKVELRGTWEGGGVFINGLNIDQNDFSNMF